MTKTIVAIFDDIAVARQVVEDLVKAEFARSSISLITNDAQNQYSRYLEKDYVPQQDAVTAGQGASFGAIVGGLTGLLVGLAALAVPGIGLAIVAGPIVAGLTGALAGTVTGGFVGALVKSGVPEDEAPYYAEGIRRGGTLVSLETSDTLRAGDIMHRYGSINIHERMNMWKQEGWQGFDAAESAANADAAAAAPPVFTPVTVNTVARTAPLTPDPSPMIAAPAAAVVIEEAPLDEGDTRELTTVIDPALAGYITPLVTPIPDVMVAEPALPLVETRSAAETGNTAK
jgi:hypothetical protein